MILLCKEAGVIVCITSFSGSKVVEIKERL